MRKQHDAELCERIRALEERVAELEAAPQHVVIPHYCTHWCNHWTGTGWYSPPQWTWTVTNSTTDTIDSTTTYPAQ